MMHDTDIPPVLTDCETCPPARGLAAFGRWCRVLIPSIVVLCLTVAGGLLALWRADAVRTSEISTLATARTEDREEMRRLRSDLVELERGHALRQEQTIQAITRTQTQLDAIRETLATTKGPRR
jgi:hypothetical protein